MKKIVVIGAGVSGLSIARLLVDGGNKVTVIEKENKPGGLIKCDNINGCLYHKVGGHVFNTKRKDVLEWFESIFDKEKDFSKADRNSVVSMPDRRLINYPVENHAYQFTPVLLDEFIDNLQEMIKNGDTKGEPTNFEEFLYFRFGVMLYREYFQPYNEKIWKRDLTTVPLSWLEGKLPMPTLKEILYNNFIHLEEKNFVHSTFFYPRYGGSQFFANKLAEELDIRYNTQVVSLEKGNGCWLVNNDCFDQVIFCGNIKDLPVLLNIVVDISSFESMIEKLEYHGTTSVFCEIEKNPYSWIYLPSREYQAHRIICTGNFSEANNIPGVLTGVVEFKDHISKEDILKNLEKIPFSPRYLTHTYTKYTYPIQDALTREMILNLKNVLEKQGLYLLGRFAEWEYYNMDAAMGAAIDMFNSKLK